MKKFLPIFLGLLILLFIVAGTAAGSKLLTPASESAKPIQASVADQAAPLVAANKGAISLGTEDDALKIAVLAQDEPPLEAKLKVTDGDVFYCAECPIPENCEFVPLDNKKEYLVEGDTIRTGADGAASLKFSDEVDLVLSSNTQIRILKYRVAEDGTVQIHIEQIVGEVYFNVKYSKKESQVFDFRIITPTAVIQQVETSGKKAFSGVSIVEFEPFMSLAPAELATKIQENFSTSCGALCVEDDCSNCEKFEGLKPVHLQVDDLTGELLVHYVDKFGVQQESLFAGERFEFIFMKFDSDQAWAALCRALNALLNGENPSNDDIDAITGGSPNIIINKGPASNCGDKVCDIYDGEDKQTCPQDCK